MPSGSSSTSATHAKTPGDGGPRPELNVAQPDCEPFHVLLENGRTYLLGRSQRCDVRLEDRRVSAVHLRLDVDNGCATLTDCGSRHGTRMNGRLLEPGCETPIEDGDEVCCGSTCIRYTNLVERACRIARALPPSTDRGIPPPEGADNIESTRNGADTVRGSCEQGPMSGCPADGCGDSDDAPHDQFEAARVGALRECVRDSSDARPAHVWLVAALLTVALFVALVLLVLIPEASP
jgi:hypothetical protein